MTDSMIVIGCRLYFPYPKGLPTNKELVQLYTWRGKLSEKDRQGFDYLCCDQVMGKQFIDETPYTPFSKMLQIAHRQRGYY